MITKNQAILAGEDRAIEIHCGECNKYVGPRGGVRLNIMRVRSNGHCQTWKTRPAEFRLPIKHGLLEYGEITQRNAESFHLAVDCPLLKEKPFVPVPVKPLEPALLEQIDAAEYQINNR